MYVAAVAVEDENVADAGAGYAFADVEYVVEKGADAGRQGSRVGHVMLGHPDLHRRRHHYLRVQGEGGLVRHVGDL